MALCRPEPAIRRIWKIPDGSLSFLYENIFNLWASATELHVAPDEFFRASLVLAVCHLVLLVKTKILWMA